MTTYEDDMLVHPQQLSVSFAFLCSKKAVMKTFTLVVRRRRLVDVATGARRRLRDLRNNF